jgi:hypothetical protein
MESLQDFFAREVAAAQAHITAMVEQQNRFWREVHESHDQWQRATAIVCNRLPVRGWYMSGQEPAPLVVQLARRIEAEAWADVDRLMLQHVPVFRLDAVSPRLASKGVPVYCIDRLRRFFDHHQKGNYEEATYLGVPLLDEVCLHLYGTEFTRKSPPTLISSTSAKAALSSLGQEFVSDFGSLQNKIEDARLQDEDYWCRHAILHGKMRRPMGIKDSAKCCMALAFLIRNHDERE